MAKNKNKVATNITKEEILTEPVNENLNENLNDTIIVTEEPVKKVIKEKSEKIIHKNYTSDNISWTTDKIILRLDTNDPDNVQISDSFDTSDYIKDFAVPIKVNKDKIGKRTKFRNNKWCIITNIIEDENLIFIVKLEK